MRQNSLCNPLKFMCLYLVAFAAPCSAEQGVVLVQVENTKHQPIRGVQIGIEGFGDSKLTNDAGKATLAVGGTTRTGEWLSVFIVHSPAKKDFVIVSPWDNRAQVPSFEDKPENFIKVVVVERGERAALEEGTVLAAFAAKINKANALMSERDHLRPLDPKEKLTEVARQYGLQPDELDKAIRSWGAKTSDPYERGLAALYEKNYAKASEDLAASLRQRNEKYETDRMALAKDPAQVADAAFFLGSSFYQQGKYRQAAESFEECLQSDGSEGLGPGAQATALKKQADLLEDKGDYVGAEPFYRKALAIYQKQLGIDRAELALTVELVAKLKYENTGHYAAAESIYRRELAITERLGPEHPYVATSLSNLANLLQLEGNYAEAESLFRRALAIRYNALGADHPDTKATQNALTHCLENGSQKSKEK